VATTSDTGAAIPAFFFDYIRDKRGLSPKHISSPYQLKTLLLIKTGERKNILNALKIGAGRRPKRLSLALLPFCPLKFNLLLCMLYDRIG
jgi:hypothetical protein